MSTNDSRSLVLAFSALLGALLLAGCATDTRFGRHGDRAIWSDAVAEQWQEPWRAVPEATLLAASVALIPLDRDIRNDYSRNSPADSAALPGDVLQYCAVGVPLAWGALDWARGDDGERFETASEALAATGLVTLLLKTLTKRVRPDGNGATSFPSGHTSAAFAGATLLARFIERDTASHSRLGYLLYLPAAYVGANRVQVDRHWATDVGAGAFIGTFIANVVIDAHYGDEARGHEGILTPRRQVRMTVVPQRSERGTCLLLRVDF